MSKPRDGGADHGADRGAGGRPVDERICSFVDGCLSPREQERFVAELRVNAQLQKDLEEYQRTVAAVREALQAPTVPTRLADRVMAAIGTPAAPPRRAPVRTWQSLLWSVVAAAALLALALWLNTWEGGPARTTVAQAPALDSSVTPAALAPRTEHQAVKPMGPEPMGPEPKEPVAAAREALVLTGEPEPMVRPTVVKVDSEAPAAMEVPSDAGAVGEPSPATPLAGADESKEARELGEVAREKDKAATAGRSSPGAPALEANDDPARRIVTRLTPPAPSADGSGTGVPAPSPAEPEARRDLAEVDKADPQAGGETGAFGARTGGGRRAGGGRGAPVRRAESTEQIPLVVFTADAKQVAVVQARSRSAAPVTGSDDFYLGSTRQGGAPTEEVPQLFGFLLQQFPGPDAGSWAGAVTMTVAPPPQAGPAGAGGGPGLAKSAPSSGPSSAGPSGPGSPVPGAPPAGAAAPAELHSFAAGLSAPVFARWPSLRFEALTAVPAAKDVAVEDKQRTDVPPPSPVLLGGGRAEAAREQAETTATERTWLVEGRRTEVAELLRRLAALARESGFQVRNGELPADAPVLSARRRLSAGEAGPADVTATPTVPPSHAPQGGAVGPDRDAMRIVLRFQTR